MPYDEGCHQEDDLIKYRRVNHRVTSLPDYSMEEEGHESFASSVMDLSRRLGWLLYGKSTSR